MNEFKFVETVKDLDLVLYGLKGNYFTDLAIQKLNDLFEKFTLIEKFEWARDRCGYTVKSYYDYDKQIMCISKMPVLTLTKLKWTMSVPFYIIDFDKIMLMTEKTITKYGVNF